MADVAVSAQLQQWSFEKPGTDDPDSSASSPHLSHPDTETLRVDTAAVCDEPTLVSNRQDSVSFQERYLSSEEDLSPLEESYSLEDEDEDEVDDDVISIHAADEECLRARKMSVSRFEKGKSCDMAVMVSMVSARPKVIDLASTSPVREKTQRSASLAQLPMAAIQKLRQIDQATRMSLAIGPSPSRSSSPARSPEQIGRAHV